MKKLRLPKVPFRIVKVSRSIVPSDDDYWRLVFENDEGDLEEDFIRPDQWLIDALSARPEAYFMGRRSVDGGWQWKGRYWGEQLFW